MKKRKLFALVSAAVLLSLCGCGASREETVPELLPAFPEETAAPFPENVVGSWSLDPIQNADLDLNSIFGSGLREYGAQLLCGEHGEFLISIGESYGGSGSYSYFEGTMTAEFISSVERESQDLTLLAVTEDDYDLLHTTILGNDIWWVRNDTAQPDFPDADDGTQGGIEPRQAM